MSYDINFWKQERALALSAEEIYGHLCSGERVEGLAQLPVDTILGQLRERFPAFDPQSQFPDVDVEGGNIEFGWSEQHFRFDLRGEVPAADTNAIVNILKQAGCPMYDPQVNKRYDTADGTAIGETPPFKDQTPEEKAAFEKLKADMMAKFEAGSTRKGCAGSAAILLAIGGGLLWPIVRSLGVGD